MIGNVLSVNDTELANIFSMVAEEKTNSKSKNKNIRYSDSIKSRIVKYVKTSLIGPTKLSNKIGIPEPTIRRWLNEAGGNDVVDNKIRHSTVKNPTESVSNKSIKHMKLEIDGVKIEFDSNKLDLVVKVIRGLGDVI